MERWKKQRILRGKRADNNVVDCSIRISDHFIKEF